MYVHHEHFWGVAYVQFSLAFYFSYFSAFLLNVNVFTYREKKQKIQDIRKNVKDAIVVSEPSTVLI